MEAKGRSIFKLLTAMCISIMVLGLATITGSASDYTSATTIKTDGSTNYTTTFTSSDLEGWYKFTISSEGEITLGVTAKCYTYFNLYTTGLEKLGSYSVNGSSSSSATNSGTYVLSKGTYYIDLTASGAGTATLKASFKSYGTNGTHASSSTSAQSVSIGQKITSAITLTDKSDWYKFNVTEAGDYVLAFTGSGHFTIELFDNKMSSVYSSYFYYSGSYSKDVTLTRGTYYVNFSASTSGLYTLSLSKAGCSHSYTSKTVKPTYFKKGYTKHTCTKCGDTYKDNYKAKKKLSISNIKNKKAGVKITWSKVSKAKGYYVYRKTGSGSYKKIATVKGASTLSYKDTKAKNGTQYTYKVVPYKTNTKGAGKGKTITFVKNNKISAVKNSSSKKAALTWTKNSKATGYQIQWSTSSNFKSNKKSVKVTGASRSSYTISGLTKGRKYYVRIRPYKKVSGKTYYGAWSSKKSVTIAK